MEYTREPTKSEIEFGHGATHYLTISKEYTPNAYKLDGTLKKFFKHSDGLYYSKGSL